MKITTEESGALKQYVGKLFDAGVVHHGKYLRLPIELLFETDETLTRAKSKVEKHHGGKGLHDLVESELHSLIETDPEFQKEMPLKHCIERSRDDILETVVEDLIAPLAKLMFVFAFPKQWSDALESTIGLPVRSSKGGFPIREFFNRLKIKASSKAIERRIFAPQSLLGISLSAEHAHDYMAGKLGMVVQGEGIHGKNATEAFDSATDLVGATYATLAIYGFLQFKPNWETSDLYVPVFNGVYPNLEIWDTPRRRGDLVEFERRFGVAESALGEEAARDLKTALLIVLSNLQEALPISLALYWLFRTYLDRSRQENILDVAICLEILAGARSTTDDPSIGTLIATKVSYAVATGYHQREQIAKSIKKFYGLRSAVIHAGKRRLTHEEEVLVFSATEYAKDFIKHEISAIAKDLSPESLKG